MFFIENKIRLYDKKIEEYFFFFCYHIISTLCVTKYHFITMDAV